MTFRDLKILQPFSFVENGPVYIKRTGKVFTAVGADKNLFQLRDPATKEVIPRELPKAAAGAV